VIAATNLNFQAAIQAGQLRQDLYYRLDVLSLRLPPLRERREDIPPLAYHFMHKYAQEFDNPVTAFSPGALRKLAQHHWPGNVRELENVIERAVALAENRMIRSNDLTLPTTTSSPVIAGSLSFHEAKARCVAQFERDYLQAMQGNITKAANAAGKDRRSFFELIHKHRIDRRSFKTSSLPS
jgi:DNA-binding NtrC family response regulator